MFTLENWAGLPAILYGELVFFGLLIALPFIDRNPERHWKRRPIFTTIVAVMLVALVALTVLRAVTPLQQHLG